MRIINFVLTIVCTIFSFMGLNTQSTSAGIISLDHGTFGVGAITRDTDQALNFLDLTHSINRSYADIVDEFGAGGDFEGFRYATEAEVVTLINNWGYPAVAGSNVAGTVGTDQLSGLVNIVEVTDTQFSGIRRATGMTGDRVGTVQPLGSGARRAVTIDDFVNNSSDADRVFAAGHIFESDVSPDFGSFLVENDTAAIPEPSTFAVLLMAGIGALTRHRRTKRQIRSN